MLLLRQFAQSLAQDEHCQSRLVIIGKGFVCGLIASSSSLPLHHQGEIDRWLLIVGTVEDYHVLIVTDGVVYALSGIGSRRRYVGKGLPYLVFYLVNVDVTHYNDGLQVGAIPLLIVVTQHFVVKGVHDFNVAYGQTVLILTAGIYHWRSIFHHALHCLSGAPCAPLLAYHSAFLVYLLTAKQERMAPVVEYQQAGITHSLLCHWGIGDVIYRLVDRGICIEVGTKLYAVSLTPLSDSTLSAVTVGEVLCAVEGHVFEEVCQSALLWLLKY